MPDGRSVYMTDDGSNKFFSIFVMDRVNDLSSGTIYAAVMTQISSKDGGECVAPACAAQGCLCAHLSWLPDPCLAVQRPELLALASCCLCHYGRC